MPLPHGVDLQAWLVGETAFDTVQAFVAADAIAPISLNIKPTLEQHKSKERVGTSSPQTHVQGKRGGTWDYEGYVKPAGLGVPPDISELIRVGLGRIEFDLTVVDYSQGGTETITSTVGGTPTVKTNGTDFTAATSNDNTASLIATELSTIAGITATANAAVVTVVCDTASLLVATSNAAFVAVTRLGYSLRGKNHTPQSLQIGRHLGHEFYEQANGAWVEQVEFQITGNDECMVRGSGGFASFSAVKGEPLTDGSSYSSATDVDLAAGQTGKIIGEPRVYFELASDSSTVVDNSGSGYAVTAVDLANGQITVSPAVTLTAAAYKIRPWIPAQTIAGTIQGGIDAGLTFGGDTLGLIGYKATVNTAIHGLDKEASANRANRLARGDRDIAIELECYALDENADHFGLAWNDDRASVTARCGPNTSGSRVLLVTPNALVEVADESAPEAEEVTRTVKLMPEQSSAAEDEFRVDLT